MAILRHRRIILSQTKKKLTLEEWHHIFGYIDPAAIKHLEKGGIIQVSDTTVTTAMRCSVPRMHTSSSLLRKMRPKY